MFNGVMVTGIKYIMGDTLNPASPDVFYSLLKILYMLLPTLIPNEYKFINSQPFHQLQDGDIVVIKAFIGWQNYAIVSSMNPGAEQVICFANKMGQPILDTNGYFDGGDAILKEVHFREWRALMADSESFTILKQENKKNTLIRAKELLKKRNRWSMFLFNSEHFMTYALKGESESGQLKNILKRTTRHIFPLILEGSATENAAKLFEWGKDFILRMKGQLKNFFYHSFQRVALDPTNKVPALEEAIEKSTINNFLTSTHIKEGAKQMANYFTKGTTANAAKQGTAQAMKEGTKQTVQYGSQQIAKKAAQEGATYSWKKVSVEGSKYGVHKIQQTVAQLTLRPGSYQATIQQATKQNYQFTYSQMQVLVTGEGAKVIGTEGSKQTTSNVVATTVGQEIKKGASGTAMSALVEVPFLIYNIYNSHSQMKNGEIDQQQYRHEVASHIGSSGGSVVGYTAGAALGAILIPVPVVGSILGGFVGGMVGSYVGSQIGEKVEEMVYNN